jgi:tartrate-resistant acid phosphatase type 5
MGRHRLGVAAAVSLSLLAAATLRGQARESRLIFLGDAGTGGSSQRAVRDQMLRFPASLAFLLGDNIYERGSKELIGPYFDQVYAPVMAKGTRFHAALGNHDVSSCTTRTMTIEPLPDDADAYRWDLLRCDVKAQLTHAPFGYIGGKRYYSVRTDAGSPPLGEIFVLDSNTLHTSQSKLATLQTDRAQVEWLERSLAASNARWKMAIMHHPMHSPAVPIKSFLFIPYSEGRAREIQLERQIAPILKRYGVDVVLAGHNHFYARMVPQNGIRYFVSGGGGRSVYEFKESGDYVAAGGGFYHFLYVRLTPERFEYYAIDREGRSRDAGWWGKGDAADHAFPPGTLPPR